eukprot:CAMPEP_0194295618 /NCGR_PEP_ID=MMETSP0169-20130528/53947_1 /TAXON_ID=218684 /ORGANISM="Corethron pennatum, Strain L29A3" /LENGTH=1111 /DNA_ID=CAMNT_0039044837 /DNA_START=238 /DNA_END=3574 /DNA_ORIENTATION=+
MIFRMNLVLFLAMQGTAIASVKGSTASFAKNKSLRSSLLLNKARSLQKSDTFAKNEEVQIYSKNNQNISDRHMIPKINEGLESRVLSYKHWTEVGKGVTLSRAKYDKYKSSSVAMSNNGDVVALGFFHARNGSSDGGQVNIYILVHDKFWHPMGNVLLGDAGLDEFGKSLCLSSDGKRLAVGAYIKGSKSGHVKIFQFDDNSQYWVQQGNDIIGTAGLSFSSSTVALSGDGNIVAVGNYGSDRETGPITKFGNTRIYGYFRNVWYKIGDIDGKRDNFFCESVLLSSDGKIVVIGAHLQEKNGHESGAVYIFRHSKRKWNLVDKVPGEGKEIAMSSDATRIVVGSHHNDHDDHDHDDHDDHDDSVDHFGTPINVFEYNKKEKKYHKFGESIYITGDSTFEPSSKALSISGDGDVLAVGSSVSKDENGVRKGYVHTFSYDFELGWTPLAAPIEGNLLTERAGSTIDLSEDGEQLVIGSFASGTKTGKVFVVDTHNAHSEYASISNTLQDSSPNDILNEILKLSSTYSPPKEAPNTLTKNSELELHNETCHDDIRYRDPDFGIGCASIKGIVCNMLGFIGVSYTGVRKIMMHCPKTCGYCEDDTKTLPPTLSPTFPPTNIPSNLPTSRPSMTKLPSHLPSNSPSLYPSGVPTEQPSGSPSLRPSEEPSSNPSTVPTVSQSVEPSKESSSSPSMNPSKQPSLYPSTQPSPSPTVNPTSKPSSGPSTQPTLSFTANPTNQPSSFPSTQPTLSPTSKPTYQPSSTPSIKPTNRPTTKPTNQPSLSLSFEPSHTPTKMPTNHPSLSPSTDPTVKPTLIPTRDPSMTPSITPTKRSSKFPSVLPSAQPTRYPSAMPTLQPSLHPSLMPTIRPSESPSAKPSVQPTQYPSYLPTSKPSQTPSHSQTFKPSQLPSLLPTQHPSKFPIPMPVSQPSQHPSTKPTVKPSQPPSVSPTVQPSQYPTEIPTMQPSQYPSDNPTAYPTNLPTTSQPTTLPTVSCRDDPKYKNFFGLSCNFYARSDCDQLYRVGLSVKDMKDAITRCPRSCGTCEEENVKQVEERTEVRTNPQTSSPTGSLTDSPTSECKDNLAFVFKYGLTCAHFGNKENAVALQELVSPHQKYIM